MRSPDGRRALSRSADGLLTLFEKMKKIGDNVPKRVKKS